MTDTTPEEEHAFYADPDNQTPQGPAVRRRPRNSAALPIRLPAEMLEQVRQRAAADDRSVSSWVRRAIEHELSRPA
jgi:predicted HicB family RNase H-like nuclease